MTVADRERQRVVYHPGVGTLTTTKEVEEALSDTKVEIVSDSRRSSRWRTGPALISRGWLSDTAQRRTSGSSTENSPYDTSQATTSISSDSAERVYRSCARGLDSPVWRAPIDRADDRRLREAWCHYKAHFESAENASRLRAQKRAVEAFRRTQSHPCTIRFLGVFDTVKSVGYMLPTNLPHTRHNPSVQTVRHAVSLGERRSFYALTTWGGLDGDTRPASSSPPAGRAVRAFGGRTSRKSGSPASTQTWAEGTPRSPIVGGRIASLDA